MGQTEGMVTPRCAASATWNPHVDVKGLEDAAGTGPWRVAGKRDEVGDTRNGVPMVPVWRFTRGGSGTWRQYRVVVGQACGIGYVESPNVRRGQGWSKR